MTRFQTVIVALACTLVAVCAGLWLGGHPSSLPNGLRKVFVADDRAVRTELINAIEDDFYKKVSKKSLEQASLKGIVDSLHDQFSAYYTPQEAKLFRQVINPQFEGVGMSIRKDPRGLKVHKAYVGNYFTSLEMVGATLTVMSLDDELKQLLAVDTDCPGF